MRKSICNRHDGAVVDCMEAEMDLWWVDVCTRKPWTFAPRRLSIHKNRSRDSRHTMGARNSRI